MSDHDYRCLCWNCENVARLEAQEQADRELERAGRERAYRDALARIAGVLNLAIGEPNTGDYVDCIIAHIRGAMDREQKAWGRWQAFYDVLTDIANHDYRGNRSSESQIAYNALQRDRRKVVR